MSEYDPGTLEFEAAAFVSTWEIRSNTPTVDYDQIVAALSRLLRAERERHGWQPIETVPKDGSDVDLWVSDERATDFHMDKIGRWCRVEGYPTYARILTAKPTHWMSVPIPPKP